MMYNRSARLTLVAMIVMLGLVYAVPAVWADSDHDDEREWSYRWREWVVEDDDRDWSSRWPGRVDADRDGYSSYRDCDDSDATIYPGAEEIPNDGIDQDCDGSDLVIEEETCQDVDGDGYKDAVCGGDDCDDSDATIHPGAEDIPNDGIDQDCDGGDLITDSENPHAMLTWDSYPANCITCHSEEADEMLQTTHYRWLGETPDMTNATGTVQGKLTNAVNSYCINILGDWPVCGSCHVGRGLRPDEAADNRDNIDCLVCHNNTYASLRMRLPDGSMGPAVPDDGFVQNVSLPMRGNCLSCHAKAGGGDAVKRGDLSLATISNMDRSFDVHMNGSGANLSCQECHTFEAHKVIGKGSDLRPTDDPARGAEVSCLTCHTDKAAQTGHSVAKINDHVARVACQTCHIPVYAKVATEIYRDWRMHHDNSPADATAAAGHPYTEKLGDLTPLYKFWNRKSDNSLLGDDAGRTYNTELNTWPTSTPVGDVSDGKLYPFKYKTAVQPKTVGDNRFIALDTFEYLKSSGNADAAVRNGLENMGYSRDTEYEWVTSDTYQLLNHGISPAGDALQCADCHNGSERIDLAGELGYQLKDTPSVVCRQCHGLERVGSFTSVHSRHVDRRGYDCSNCHTFTRPERNLSVRNR